MQRLPLADCGRYGVSCRECILSRDPYCAWDMSKRKCTAIPANYNISTGYKCTHKYPNTMIHYFFPGKITVSFFPFCSLYFGIRTLFQTLDHSSASVCGDATGRFSFRLLKVQFFFCISEPFIALENLKYIQTVSTISSPNSQ